MTADDGRSPHPDLHLAEIRALAQRFSPEELEACIHDQIEEGANVCEPSGRTEEIVGVLAKAEYVKALMEKAQRFPKPCANWDDVSGRCSKVSRDGRRHCIIDGDPNLGFFKLE